MLERWIRAGFAAAAMLAAGLALPGPAAAQVGASSAGDMNKLSFEALTARPSRPSYMSTAQAAEFDGGRRHPAWHATRWHHATWHHAGSRHAGWRRSAWHHGGRAVHGRHVALRRVGVFHRLPGHGAHLARHRR